MKTEGSRNSIDIMEAVAAFFQGLPYLLRCAILYSAAFGLLAHLFAYTNPLFLHDDASIYDQFSSLSGVSTASRWGEFFLYLVQGGIKLPWIYGFFSLILYGISAYIIAGIFEIKRQVPLMLLCALMITSPTATCAHLYVGGTLCMALALLSACLAVSSLLFWKHGWIFSFFFLMISESLYAAYLSVSLALFLFYALLQILKEPGKEEKKLICSHFLMLFLSAFSMLLTYILIRVFTAIGKTGVADRVENVTGRSVTEWIKKAVETLGRLLYAFLPGGTSYFWGNKILFFLFWITLFATLIVLIRLAGKRLHGKKLLLLLFVFDILCLPLGINAIGLLNNTYTLMHWSYITPWIFMLALYEALFHDEALGGILGEKQLKTYSVLVFSLMCITIINGLYLANASYTRAYAIYESAMQLTTRVSDRIEQEKGYEPGVTPVYIVGDLREHYAPKREEMSYLYSMAGVGSTMWDIGMRTPAAMQTYLLQQAGLDINLMPLQYDSASEIPPAEHFAKYRENVDPERFNKLLEETPAFPYKDCTFWYDDVLVVKLGERRPPEEPDLTDFAHRIRNMLDPYDKK